MKYKVLKEFEEREWKVGDIIYADTFSARQLIETGYVEPYDGDLPTQHVVINVDPISLSAVNKT
jgi:hypothetical protein